MGDDTAMMSGQSSNDIAAAQMSAASQNLPESYSYEQLPDYTCNIRLIRLLPSAQPDTPIELELCPARLDATLSYEALSYCWGDVSLTETVYIDRRLFDVTTNLAAALRALRCQTEPRIVWVDAVCINQLDIPEKNSQVRIMRDIYSLSSRTIVWLGTGDEHTRDAFREPKQPQFFNPRGFKEILRAFYSSRRMLRASAAIMRQPWPTRVWVVQEVAFSKVITVQCGSDQLDWEDYVEVYNNFDINPFAIEAVSPVTGIRSSRSKFSSRALVEIMWDTRSRILSGQRLTLHEALRKSRVYDASRPIDKVYAIAGMIQDPDSVNIDYAKSSHEVFRDVTFQVIAETKSLDILRDAVQDQHDPTQSSMMSWTPDWANNKRLNAQDDQTDEIPKEGEVAMPWRASCGMFSMPKLHKDDTLELKAQFIARIEELGQPLPSLADIASQFWPKGKRLPN